MVKILADGSIVADDDPRAAGMGSTTRRAQQQPSDPQRKGISTLHSRASGSSASSGAASSNVPRSGGAAAASSAGGSEDDIFTGELATMLGIKGREVELMGRKVPLIYTLIGGLLACLWLMGQFDIIRMLAMALGVYWMYTQYQKMQSGSRDSSASFRSGGSVPSPAAEMT